MRHLAPSARTLFEKRRVKGGKEPSIKARRERDAEDGEREEEGTL